MQAKVTQILEPMTDRTSKAGKPYKAMKLRLETDDGQSIDLLSFDEQAIGTSVQVVKNGEYYSIPKAAPKDEDRKILQLIYDQNIEILSLLHKLTGEDVDED